VDCQEVAQILLATTSASVQEVWPIAGGWASWTFEVDGHLIVRFPRNAEVAAGTSAEIELLPRLAPMVDFAVPTIQSRGEHAGRPFFSYERIGGTGLRPADLDYHPGLGGEIAAALRQLHTLPLTAFGDSDASVEAWRAKYWRLRVDVTDRVLALLDAETSTLLTEAWDRFEAGLTFRPALVHADLGVEHILVSGGHLAGIIDWETAGPGDPAIDFVGLWLALGPERTSAILSRYHPPDLGLRARIPAYVWLSAVHEILYGLDEDRPEILAEGLARLRDRLGAAGRRWERHTRRAS
jgi:aminoglycoside 2''-phosphotransferase